MYCKYCGSETQGEEIICEKCKVERGLVSEPRPVTQPIPQPAPMQNPSNKPADKKMFPVIIAICAAAIAIILAIILAVVMLGGNKNDTEVKTEVKTEAGSEIGYYLASDGTNVIIYSTKNEPVEVTDVLVKYLDSDTIQQLTVHIPCASLTDARNMVSQLKNSAVPMPGEYIVNFTAKHPDTGAIITEPIRVHADSHVISDIATRRYTRSEIEAMGLTDAELFIARLELRAMEGYTYKDPYLYRYFKNNCSWYHPYLTDYDALAPTGAGGSNYAVISEIETARGSWYPHID